MTSAWGTTVLATSTSWQVCPQAPWAASWATTRTRMTWTCFQTKSGIVVSLTHRRKTWNKPLQSCTQSKKRPICPKIRHVKVKKSSIRKFFLTPLSIFQDLFASSFFPFSLSSSDDGKTSLLDLIDETYSKKSLSPFSLAVGNKNIGSSANSTCSTGSSSGLSSPVCSSGINDMDYPDSWDLDFWQMSDSRMGGWVRIWSRKRAINIYFMLK